MHSRGTQERTAEQRSHALRRLRVTAHPDWLALVEGDTPAAVVRRVLDADDALILSNDEVETHRLMGDDVNDTELALWWFDRLRSPDAGLHERMVWFWHNHLTSSLDKGTRRANWRQHHLLRTHALGNFRTLLQAIAIDGAMLQFLDGDGSSGDAPNENFARELMELFTLGVGNYTEEDIRVAARGFSGWRVDYETGDVAFDPDAHYARPLRFFGERRRWTARALIDKICDMPECAAHVVGRLHAHLVGGELTPERRSELAAIFRDNDLEILPLVEAMVDHPEFLDSIHTRPKTGVEWLAGVGAAVGPELEIENWWLDQLGQVPFYPPNVAGWPEDDRWLGASQVLAHTNILLNFDLPDSVVDEVEATVDNVLARCGLFDVSATTRAALNNAIDRQPEYDNGLELLLLLTLNSPEYLLA